MKINIIRHIPKVLAIILAMSFILCAPLAAYATLEIAEISKNIVSGPDLSTQAPMLKKPNLPKATYSSDFAWDSKQTLHGIFSSTDLYFTVPSYWDTRYAYIQVEYRVSQLIKGAPCSLTFTINDHPFYSCQISYNNSETQTLYVPIPRELMKNDAENISNHLEVSGYARLYDEEGCIDDFTNASWITISEASGVRVGYEVKPHNNRIDYYPYPFMSSLNLTGSNTAIEVSNTSENEEVATAMFIMSNLSNNTVNDNKITVGSRDDLITGSFKNRIFIGLAKDIPLELQEYTKQYQDQLKGQAMILFVNDKKNNNQPLLLIISENADCLMEAAHLLADRDRVIQEKSNVTFVKKGSAETKAKAKQAIDMKADRYTMQGMTGGGLKFVGPFHQIKTLFLPISSDYMMSSAGKVSLNFRYSKNLDFKRSMLTVYWGEIPIGSKKLTFEKADGDELTLLMPMDVVGTNAGKVMFAFDLEIPDIICTPRQEDMPWAYITQNSSLYLPRENNVKLEFGNRPSPFQKNGSLNDVLMIMSDHPTSSELTLLGRIISIYGKGADAYGKLKVCKVSEFSEKDANYNIITSGTPSTNSLILKNNDKLYFKYTNDGEKFLTNDKLILSDNYSKSIGTLQLLQSPYARNRALLVLTGPNDQTLQMVNKLISNEKLSWNLKNDFVLIDSEGKTKSYQFQQSEIKDQKLTLAKSVAENKRSLLFTLAATSVMLVIFLAMVLIILRWKRGKNTDQ